jgi:dihydrolipoamide dehydrogenase
MKESVQVAIIGAGHAGLNAIKEVRKVTDSWVLIDAGPLGTTCARVGCMPSKVALHLADSLHGGRQLGRYGVDGAERLSLEPSAALEQVRDLRDTFVDLVLANTTDDMDPSHLIEGYAEFIDARTLRVGDREIEARAVIVATGARSVVPPEWQPELGNGVLTVDNLFEQERLPASMAVIGLGPIGLEIGQVLHRLGVQVTGIDHGAHIARIQDPALNRAAVDILSREFPLWLGEEPEITRDGERFRVRAGEREVTVDKLFLAQGRRPSLAGLGTDRLGVPVDDRQVPRHDPATLRVGRTGVYLAGDATGGIANLQRAAEQGRIAGWNATHRRKRRCPPRTPMSILFTEPNIACVGRHWDELDPKRTAVAEQRFGPVGRALIMGRNRGLLRLYADRRGGRLLGAAMIGPRCEHLAHLLAWAIESRMTVERALEMPFYHPVIEEALQDALLELRKALARPPRPRRQPAPATTAHAPGPARA